MWSHKKTRQGLKVIRVYGRRHKGILLRGVLASVGVVLIRLAMPWPLRGIIEVTFQNGRGDHEYLAEMLPESGSPALWFCFAYFILAAGAGCVELVQRVSMKRFAAQTVHDMRAVAARSTSHWRNQGGSSAELITRLIGDSARVKAGLSGILVHGFQNGLLYIGVSALLLVLSPELALFFVGAGALAVLIGFSASSPVAASAQRHRRKESAYAIALHAAIDLGDVYSDDRLNELSARKDVETTRLVSLATLLVHVTLATVLGAGLWYGYTRVQANLLAPGELFLFVAYTLIVHRRMVQVGRQFARGGKVLACARRIGQLIPADRAESSQVKCGALCSSLCLQEVGLASQRSRRDRPRLRDISLTVAAGSRVAIMGSAGSGKSSLLQILAGAECPTKGEVLWDGEQVTVGDECLREQVAYCSSNPVFPLRRVWRIIGLADPESAQTEDSQVFLRELGLLSFVNRLPKGIRSSISSHTVSSREAQALKLASVLSDHRSVWALDDPFARIASLSKAQRLLNLIFDRAGERTVIMTLARKRLLDAFDQVVVLRRGRIVFSGTPSEWKEILCRR